MNNNYIIYLDKQFNVQPQTSERAVKYYQLLSENKQELLLNTSRVLVVKNEEITYSTEIYEMGYLLLVNVRTQENDNKIVKDKFYFLGEMCASIIHDINNPLNIAITSCELTKYELEESNFSSKPAILDYINKTEESLTLITDIVDGVLSFCRQGQKSTKLVNLVDLIKKTSSFLKGNLQKKNIRFNLLFENGDDFNIKCYDNLMVQVVANLLKNSIEAVENEEPLNRWIEISLIKQPSEIIIRVTDGGCINPKTALRVFEPLFTTKHQKQGTGLGLPFCKQIMEAHGGGIKINYQFKNTTFDLNIPLIINS